MARFFLLCVDLAGFVLLDYCVYRHDGIRVLLWISKTAQMFGQLVETSCWQVLLFWTHEKEYNMVHCSDRLIGGRKEKDAVASV